jgi:hypothetical protein
MTATAIESKVRANCDAAIVKPRAPKAIAVSKLIGGKLVTQLAKSEFLKLQAAQKLCVQLDEITEWQNETRGAAEALSALLTKCYTAPAT